MTKIDKRYLVPTTLSIGLQGQKGFISWRDAKGLHSEKSLNGWTKTIIPSIPNVVLKDCLVVDTRNRYGRYSDNMVVLEWPGSSLIQSFSFEISLDNFFEFADKYGYVNKKLLGTYVYDPVTKQIVEPSLVDWEDNSEYYVNKAMTKSIPELGDTVIYKKQPHTYVGHVIVGAIEPKDYGRYYTPVGGVPLVVNPNYYLLLLDKDNNHVLTKTEKFAITQTADLSKANFLKKYESLILNRAQYDWTDEKVLDGTQNQIDLRTWEKIMNPNPKGDHDYRTQDHEEHPTEIRGPATIPNMVVYTQFFLKEMKQYGAVPDFFMLYNGENHLYEVKGIVHNVTHHSIEKFGFPELNSLSYYWPDSYEEVKKS